MRHNADEESAPRGGSLGYMHAINCPVFTLPPLPLVPCLTRRYVDLKFAALTQNMMQVMTNSGDVFISYC